MPILDASRSIRAAGGLGGAAGTRFRPMGTVVQITPPRSPRRDQLIVLAEHRAVCEYMRRPGLSVREWRMLWLRRQSLELEHRLVVATPRAKRVPAIAERIQSE